MFQAMLCVFKTVFHAEKHDFHIQAKVIYKCVVVQTTLYIHILKQYRSDLYKQVNNSHNINSMESLCITLSYLLKIKISKLEGKII